MALFANFFWLAFAIGILVWGANKFIDSSSLLAKELGLSELTIGLTIIALGTSAPEIFIAISSVINNTGEIAMGTVVGSNISNIALIFGVSCIGISYRPTSTSIHQFIPFFLAASFLGYALYDLRVNIFESLISGNLPTRAELNDIVSTIEMGASGLVLAAETAISRILRRSV